MLSPRKVNWQGRKGNLWKPAREIKVKPHTSLISHWKPQTIPGKEETIMLSLILDVSNLLKCFSILWEGTKFPEFSIYSSLRTLDAVFLSFDLGSSSTIVSFCWSVSSGIGPWDREDEQWICKHWITQTQQENSSFEFGYRLENTQTKKLRWTIGY